MRRLSLILLILTCGWLPLAWMLDLVHGVDGYEMKELNPPKDWPALAKANAPATTDDWLSSVYGTPAVSEVRRFVFVPEQRIVRTTQGYTLIQFDRGHGEEFLQARTLRNLALLATGLTGGLTLMAAAVCWRMAKRPAAPAAMSATARA